MTAASPQQLADWAARAGFTGVDRAYAVAVALAAGADPASAKGAWGIGPGNNGLDEAVEAFNHWKLNGWPGFPTHADGSFALYMPTATAVAPFAHGIIASEAPADPGVNVLGLLDPLGEAGVLAQLALNPNTWLRGTKMAIGFVLICLGGAMMFREYAFWPLHLFQKADNAVARQADSLAGGGWNNPNFLNAATRAPIVP